MDKSNQERIARSAKKQKEALDLDIRIVEEFMKQDSDEKESLGQKKNELRIEMLEYKTYLDQMRAYEKKREEEVDTMYRNEEDRIWNIRNEKWTKEQAARDKLMMEVIQGRKDQLRFAGICVFIPIFLT